MPIETSPFGGTTLSGKEAREFVETFFTNPKPNPRAIETARRAKALYSEVVSDMVEKILKESRT